MNTFAIVTDAFEGGRTADVASDVASDSRGVSLFFSRVFESHLPEPLGDRARVPDQASLGGCGDRAREPLVVAQRRVVRALERGAA